MTTVTHDDLLVASGLVKWYPSQPESVIALDHIDTTIGAGEFVAVVGPSGSGKTTLLNCLSGLDTVDAGTVEFDGVDLAAADDATRTDLRRTQMGFVFQTPNLLPVFSAVENVALPLVFGGMRRAEARRVATDALTRVGVGHRSTQRPGEMSGGEQQRVSIARAFVTRPRVVWADEPTGHLDSVSAELVMDVLGELRADGTTLVLVTHDLALAARADRQLELRDGRLTGERVH
jgi:putative ABC transport system ATP-binding protein